MGRYVEQQQIVVRLPGTAATKQPALSSCLLSLPAPDRSPHEDLAVDFVGVNTVERSRLAAMSSASRVAAAKRGRCEVDHAARRGRRRRRRQQQRGRGIAGPRRGRRRRRVERRPIHKTRVHCLLKLLAQLDAWRFCWESAVLKKRHSRGSVTRSASPRQARSTFSAIKTPLAAVPPRRPQHFHDLVLHAVGVDVVAAAAAAAADAAARRRRRRRRHR